MLHKYWSLLSFLVPPRQSGPHEPNLAQPLCWSFGCLFSDPVLTIPLFCLGSCTRGWCANGFSQTLLPTGLQLGSASGKLCCGSYRHGRGVATANDAGKQIWLKAKSSNFFPPALPPIPVQCLPLTECSWKPVGKGAWETEFGQVSSRVMQNAGSENSQASVLSRWKFLLIRSFPWTEKVLNWERLSGGDGGGQD